MLTTILFVFAFVLFALAAIGVPSSRYNLVAAGLACWILGNLLALVKAWP